MKKYRAKSFLGLILVLLLTSMAGVSTVMADEVQAAAEIPVSQTFKVYNTDSSNVDGKFEYVFAPAEEGTPMPAGSSADGYSFYLEGDQSTVIPAITYVHAGVYKYTVQQVISTEKSGYSYDKSVFNIEVHVRNQGEDLITDIVAYNDSSKAQSIAFENSYTAATEPPETKPTTKPTDEDSKPAQTGQRSSVPVLTITIGASFLVLVFVRKRKKESE